MFIKVNYPVDRCPNIPARAAICSVTPIALVKALDCGNKELRNTLLALHGDEFSS